MFALGADVEATRWVLVASVSAVGMVNAHLPSRWEYCRQKPLAWTPSWLTAVATCPGSASLTHAVTVKFASVRTTGRGATA